MASTIHVQMISDPSLLDVVDDYWREDHLPDDGKAPRKETQKKVAPLINAKPKLLLLLVPEASTWLSQIYHCLKGSRFLERKQ